MKRLKSSVLGQKTVERFIQSKHIDLVKGNHTEIGNIVENMIQCIIKHNLLLTTNVNIIVMIEEHNKLLT